MKALLEALVVGVGGTGAVREGRPAAEPHDAACGLRRGQGVRKEARP